MDALVARDPGLSASTGDVSHAILIVGHGSEHRAGALTRIGETLLAAASPWRVHRLAPGAGERTSPDRLEIRRQLDALAARSGGNAVVVVAGTVSRTNGDWALITGPHHREYPDDSTLPLSWIGERLRRCSVAQLLVVLAIESDTGTADPQRYLRAIGDTAGHTLLAVEDAGNARSLEALAEALGGAAVDASTGTVTGASLHGYLTTRVPGIALQGAARADTLVSAPGLGTMWELGLTVPARPAPASEASRMMPPLTGSVLPGRFAVADEISRGQFGAIYRARQLTVGRDVAVKVLHDHLASSSEDGRLFMQEIQAVGRIDHANVVRIHQADVTHDGRLFYAMELLDGRTLQDLVDHAPVPRERAVSLVQQLLAGLGAAHDVGLVHADIKPANAIVVDGANRERLVLVDFGLARLRPVTGTVDSAGGTPAYMAPEQLTDGRIDARSDLFSVALVLLALLTGWRRRRAGEVVPPRAVFDSIEDQRLRNVLLRALTLDPAGRFQSASELAAALAGEQPAETAFVERPPFRGLAAFTEDDRGRLFGRDVELATLTEHVLFGRRVVFTGPPGTGKTSILRAGLVPRLTGLGATAVYASCRLDPAAAIRSATRSTRARLVILLDQLETILDDDQAVAQVLAELSRAETAPTLDVSVVLSVREDMLARLLGRRELRTEGVPIVRLGPMTAAGARNAILRPLAERRMTIEPALLDQLLGDLAAAGDVLASELGWKAEAAIYPPHLQLACTVLHDALEPGTHELTLAHYRTLGGVETIVGEHLDRVMERELTAEETRVARDIFLALVSAAHTRTARTDDELSEAVSHDREQVAAVLDVLGRNGLVVRVRRAVGDPVWELVHDCLVPRVIGWIDRRDLARRRAQELLRYHLRRSRPGIPSLLSRVELREIDAHDDAVAELDVEWRQRRKANAQGETLTPSSLVTASRRIVRRRLFAAIALVATVVTVIAAAAADRWSVAASERRDRRLRDRDLGRFTLDLKAFDWDESALTATPVGMDTLPDLDWSLHAPDDLDPDSPGSELRPDIVTRRARTRTEFVLREDVEAPGRAAFLVVRGRGRSGERCAPSVIPLRTLPGYAQRNRAATVRVDVPTCRASASGMVEIPAGPFVFGGVGEPPSPYKLEFDDIEAEAVVELPAFSMDRTEVTNAAFRTFTSMSALHDISAPTYSRSGPLAEAGGPTYPAGGVTWREARAYCRFLGKDLPTSREWEKSMRGGDTLLDGHANPYPRRTLPWGDPSLPITARLAGETIDESSPLPVATVTGDVSPYGIRDLAGNVMEWTSSPSPDGLEQFRTARGGSWEDSKADALVDYMAIENPRPVGTRTFSLGWRCCSRSATAGPER